MHFSDKFRCHFEYSNALNIQLTQRMKEARTYLSDSYSVFLLGRAGEGKTTAAFKLVKCLVDENVVSLERCAILYEPEDLKAMKSSDVDLLLIDDIFGKHNAEENKFASWRSFFPTLQAFVGNLKVRLIFASRMHIYLEFDRKLHEYDIFSRTVDLTSAEMTHDEKRCVLQTQLQANDREMTAGDVEKCIHQEETNVGFPLCAQQFASDDTLFSKKSTYFAKPSKYIENNICNIDEQSLIALLFVFYKGNKLHASDVNITKMSETSKAELKHIATLCGKDMSIARVVKDTNKMLNNLKGSYLKCIDKTFSFLHDTMYETVAKLHALEYPDEVIKYCTVDYFCQCIRIENDGSDDHIFIEKDDFKSLAKRCVKEVIETEDGRRLSTHPMFRSELFVKELISSVLADENIFIDFFTKGLSFNYVGIHAFLYHIIINDNEKFHFLNEVRQYLHCNHHNDSDDLCWKCKVKSEALCAVCGINRKDLYYDFRAQNVTVSTLCLYKAVENKDVDPELVKSIISDLKLSGNYLPDKQDLQRCLGLAMAQSNEEIFDILKTSGIHYTNHSLYFAVKHRDEELVRSILNELTKTKTWIPDDMYTVRAMTEAHATRKTKCMSLLTKAGAKLTVASVYWATIEHDFDEVKYAIERLKESDTFDPEAYMMSWSLAKAMENGDKRIYNLLNKEGVLPTHSLVYALAEIGHNVHGIFQIIEELKVSEKWDPEHLHVAGAYMASCKRADQRLTEMLASQGAGINPACLNMAVAKHQLQLNHVMNTLKEQGRLDPSNKHIANAFIWSFDFKDKTINDMFVSEGLYLTMSGLPAAATMMSTDTLENVIDGLKKADRWNPDDDSALEALNGAIIKQDKTAYDMLLDAGLTMKPRSLKVAVEYETVHGVKLIIKEMGKLGLLKPLLEDINDAVLLARSYKDQRKFQLLRNEGICT